MPGVLCLLLILFSLSCSQAQTAMLRESAERIQHNVQQALDLLLFGMSGYIYPAFSGFVGSADLTMVRIHPDTLKQIGASAVNFVFPNTVKVFYPSSCFCVDFSAIMLYNWFIFTVSSYATFTTCVSGTITMNFIQASKEMLGTRIDFKYSSKNVVLTNPIAKIFGIEKAVATALASSTTWNEYLDKSVQGIWKNLSHRMLNTSYSVYKVDVDYSTGTITHALPFSYSRVGEEEKIVELAYGEKKYSERSDVRPNSDVPALEHVLSAEFFAELYAKAMLLGWKMNVTAADVPQNMTVKLDTKTFSQAIPDLMMERGVKNLFAGVNSLSSDVTGHVDAEREELKVSGVRFAIRIYDWEGKQLLEGEFLLSLVLCMKLKSNNFVIRLVPSIKRTEVSVTKLTSERYRSVIKNGLGAIIQAMLDEYFSDLYKDKTLGNGIALTTFNEKPDLDKSHVIYRDKTVTATVYYRSS